MANPIMKSRPDADFSGASLSDGFYVALAALAFF